MKSGVVVAAFWDPNARRREKKVKQDGRKRACWMMRRRWDSSLNDRT